MQQTVGRHAVILGAGMGGLAAAKTVCPYFERVTLVERDTLPVEPAHRSGIPQARHTHVLLGGGLAALATMFPSIEHDLDKAGAVRMRSAFDAITERPGFDPFPRRDLGLTQFSMSRPLLEFVVRGLVLREPNVGLLQDCRARDLVATPDGASITGVRLERRGETMETMDADLVIDATGRATPTLSVLDAVGLGHPAQTEIVMNLSYASGIFEIQDDAPRDWTALFHLPSAPDSSRGAIIYPIEHGRWIVTFSGCQDNVPPGDPDGFLAFARGLRTPTAYNALRYARRVGEIVRFRLRASTRRHFGAMPRFPGGLLPIADSICQFNPAFGQGMSVAAQQAQALGRLLARRGGLTDPLDGLTQAFFAEIEDLLAAPWSTAELDFIYPETGGNKPPDFQERIRFGAALTRLAAEDPAVHRTVLEVASLLKPQSALRAPDLVQRVIALMDQPSETGRAEVGGRSP
jgi:2-polyprenyl-6-methoxyphenol hydroxylase-like FAD-dependent oxidoreductase